jgi:protein phosphatase
LLRGRGQHVDIQQTPKLERDRKKSDRPDKSDKSGDADTKNVEADAKAKAESAGVPKAGELPKIEYEEDVDVDPTLVGAKGGAKPTERKSTPASAEDIQTRDLYDDDDSAPASVQAPAVPIVYDKDAADDEPTHAGALIVTSGAAQTDPGLRRKRNEDSLLVSEELSLYVVADGMGGYAGGELASNLAVTTIRDAFGSATFAGEPHDNLPRRASELVRAIQMANAAIFTKAKTDPKLTGMGTTTVAARFSPNKQRLYVGHVGDSRVYRFRAGSLQQVTADHTMKESGDGRGASTRGRPPLRG